MSQYELHRANLARPQIEIRSDVHMRELDGLRGLAILLVILLHCWAQIVVSEPGSPLAYGIAALRLAWSGVDLFFVISGFLIGGILLDARDTSNYFQVFFTRRACRILPLYAVLLAAFWLLTAVATRGQIGLPGWLVEGLAPAIIYVTFTLNIWMAFVNDIKPLWIAPTWSLGVEEQFYLLLPFVMRYTPLKWIPPVMGLAVLSAPLIRTVLFALPSSGIATYTLLPARTDALCLGVLAAWLVRDSRAYNLMIRFSWVPHMLLGIHFIGMGYLTVYAYHGSSLLLASVGYTWVALFYFYLLLVLVLFPDTPLGALARLRLLRMIGFVSYGMYLLHLPVNYTLHWLLFQRLPKVDNLASLLVNVFSMIVLFGFAYLSMWLLEQPMIERGRRMLYKRRVASGSTKSVYTVL